jgi:tetratricopeptide (TPR) repeat protein
LILGKGRRNRVLQARGTQAGSLLAAAATALVLGLALGYHFGSRAALSSNVAAASAASAASSVPLANPTDLAAREAAFETALRVNPNDVDALTQLGSLYYDSGRFREAVDRYGQALQLRPRDVNVRTDRGTSYWNLGQADAAIAEFLKSLEVNPSHAQTLYNLGVVYLNGKNDRTGARTTWERLLQAHPEYPQRAKLEGQIAALATAAPAPRSIAGVEELLDNMRSRP